MYVHYACVYMFAKCMCVCMHAGMHACVYMYAPVYDTHTHLGQDIVLIAVATARVALGELVEIKSICQRHRIGAAFCVGAVVRLSSEYVYGAKKKGMLVALLSIWSLLFQIDIKGAGVNTTPVYVFIYTCRDTQIEGDTQ